MSAKKITSFIVLIIVILLIIFGVFYFLDKKESAPTGTDTGTDTGLPIGGSAGNDGFGNNGGFGNDNNVILSPGEVFDANGDVVKKPEARLRQITTELVAGGSIDQKTIIVEDVVVSEEEGNEDETVEIEKTEYLTYFIQKNNGHVFLDSDHEENLIKVLNKTIPQTELGIITEDFAIMQYLDSTKEVINSFAGTFRLEKLIETDDDGNEIEKEETIFDGIILPNNIKSLTLSPDKTEIAFLLRNNLTTNILVADVNNFNNISLVYSTPLLDISLEWGSDEYLYITSKADSRAKGFVKRISPSTGSEITLLSGIYGLTAKPSPDGQNILLSNSTNEDSALLLYNTIDDLYNQLGLYTLPEKCVWSMIEPSVAYCAGQSFRLGGKLPQDWYQNKVSFADILWKIDTVKKTTTELYTFPSIDNIFDMKDLQLSPDENRLFFIDKNTSTPWVLNLEGLPN